ncbi:histone H4 [Colletotrichum eremochloae]|nr:histone H4 [Colletotrichum eremochloae]
MFRNGPLRSRHLRMAMGGSKRGRKIFKHNTTKSLSKPAIRRLARRGGVKRISYTVVVYSETQLAATEYLKLVIRNAVTYAAHAKRNTVVSLDIVHALKRLGKPIYGFG